MKNWLFYFLFMACLTDCKSSQEINFQKGIEFEDTLFKNKNDELFAISNKLNSEKLHKSILVILDGKKMSFTKFKNSREIIDSTYKIKVIKDKKEILKHRIANRFKTIILIDKKSL
ncbi:MAG: hypothetical protein ACWIPI_09860 [Polaribacter sp.]